MGSKEEMILPWILANWRLIAIGSLIIGIFALGWHIHALEDKAAEVSALTKRAVNAEQALRNISEFNQALNEANLHVKDPCVNSAMPSAYLKLRKH